MALSSGDNPFGGQLTATTTPASLGTHPCSTVCVQNYPGSTPNLLVGGSNGQYFVLKPGSSITIPCGNVSQVYVVAASGTATVNWISVQ